MGRPQLFNSSTQGEGRACADMVPLCIEQPPNLFRSVEMHVDVSVPNADVNRSCLGDYGARPQHWLFFKINTSGRFWINLAPRLPDHRTGEDISFALWCTSTAAPVVLLPQ